MHLFHKWKYQDEELTDTFLGHPVKTKFRAFRECKICGVVQSFSEDSQGGCWFKLDPVRAKIFRKEFNAEVTGAVQANNLLPKGA